MPSLPLVDVNLFVYNGELTVGAAIESVLAQTWPAIRLTVMDDGSTDSTLDVLSDYVRRDPAISLRRRRTNSGAIVNFQHAFWHGDADFVLPKSGDDLLAPDFVAKIMGVLLDSPNCAMCHAGGLVFTGHADVRGVYPTEHRLWAVDTDAVKRAAHVMARYTSSPSFWGIYRRESVDKLAPIRYRAGWDHALLAELALYGDIRHVPEPLYWRRNGGRAVVELARAATERGSRRLAVDDVETDQRWRTPLITTAYAHIETFALARVPRSVQLAVTSLVPEIFRARWGGLLRQEAEALRASLPELKSRLPTDRLPALASIGELFDLVRAGQAIVPEVGLLDCWSELWVDAGVRDVAIPAAV